MSGSIGYCDRDFSVAEMDRTRDLTAPGGPPLSWGKLSQAVCTVLD